MCVLCLHGLSAEEGYLICLHQLLFLSPPSCSFMRTLLLYHFSFYHSLFAHPSIRHSSTLICLLSLYKRCASFLSYSPFTLSLLSLLSLTVLYTLLIQTVFISFSSLLCFLPSYHSFVFLHNQVTPLFSHRLASRYHRATCLFLG